MEHNTDDSELLFPTLRELGRDSEIAPTEEGLGRDSEIAPTEEGSTYFRNLL